jgi:outer membrane receptor protein involved in Fe transport
MKTTKALAPRNTPRLTQIAALLATTSLALLSVGTAMAQSAATPAESAADKSGGLNLDSVVVTGTSTKATKMKQSVSISTIGAEDIAKSAPTNAAEILRSIPGVHSESSGGEGNANLTVRGVPISAGGARYVQFQEDGLPILLFGDIAFGTADQFLRADANLERVEVIRGGSASTLATNSPGGIVNFISKTGAEAGGSVALTAGLGRKELRADVDYGGSLGASTTFHVGGFQHAGDGGRPAEFNTERGGQIKANLTQKFDAGYVRVSLKALDDKTPSFLPVPVRTTNGVISTIPGVDPRTAYFITNSLTTDTVLGADGKMVATNAHDGLHVKSTAVGLEASFRLGDGWTLDEKFRKADNSGRFIALFPADNGIGSVGAAKFTATLFNTSIDDLGNTVNDLRVSKVFGGDGNKLTAMAGLFTSSQDVALTWFWNQYSVDMSGTHAKATFLNDGFTTWGNCCTRNFAVKYDTTSPFAALTWEGGPLTIDGSIRDDSEKAKGWFQSGSATTKTWDPATRKTVNYKISHTSYSLGSNFAINRDLSLFARASDGVANSADRLLYGKPVDGSIPVDFNQVRQVEAGAKWRNGPLSTFVTLFDANTKESNYEATTRKFTNNTYSAKGLELEASYRVGAFRLNGGATLTSAKITAAPGDAAAVGKKPRRLSDVVFQLTPSYSIGPVEFGAGIIGTGKSYGDDDNTITLPAYTVVNAFANYAINDKITVSVSANNLFNVIGYTEVEGDGHAARSINGRAVKATLKYAF